MIERYSRPEAAAIWSEQRRFAIMLEIELLACEAMEELGLVPHETAAACRRGAAPLLPDRFPAERIAELEATLKHDVIAFLTAVNEVIGEPSRHLHKGMTSSDVLDTALAAQLKEAGELILSALDGALAALKARAEEHIDTLCIGRSHGIHAEPTTFGLKLTLLWDALHRSRVRLVRAIDEVAVGKVSGAVGTFAHLPPAVEEHVCRRLGLKADPVSSQIVQRDRHAHFFHALALLGATVEQIAVEIRHLQRTEVGEAEEPFTAGQKGSSAMPHKRNPILSENLTGLARLLRGYADSAMENVALWHERDISHSSVERVIAPDATILAHFMLHRLQRLIAGLVVYPENMRRNLQMTGGLFYAQRVMLALVEAGSTREAAYALVQAQAMRVFAEGGSLLDRLKADPEVSSKLSPEELDALADPAWYARRAREIQQRVFWQASQEREIGR